MQVMYELELRLISGNGETLLTIGMCPSYIEWVYRGEPVNLYRGTSSNSFYEDNEMLEKLHDLQASIKHEEETTKKGLNYDVKWKHKFPVARHGHFWSLASLPLPLPLPLPEKIEMERTGNPVGSLHHVCVKRVVIPKDTHVDAACDRRCGSTGARAVHAGVRLDYDAGAARVRLNADGCGHDSGRGEEMRVGSASRGDGGASAGRVFGFGR
ncbi:hypothetical protein E6C27_scaffold409G00090 [Cucumis melo var. makuwa]|uniref:Uncharacterized protein n=1 Tax=Cucumis melo var. makuwa TaxID=1194695 RepID=A0A5A7UT43_CUCMM|nr:hypothetical protein E6C27_scaffold409G00090 [Cucumis melo var. makuwa]